MDDDMMEILSFPDLDWLDGAGSEENIGFNEANEDQNSEAMKARRNARRRQARRLHCVRGQLQV
jgi:hypothetical protein